MSCFKNNRFVLISTNELSLPVYIKDILSASGLDFKEVRSLDEAMPELDVLYMTRIQQERFATKEEYLQQKGYYILDRKKLENAKHDLVILHPLPRVDEIAMEVDDDERALYFKQAKYGMFVRMALILTILESKEQGKSLPLIIGREHKGVKCSNPGCVTNHELYLPKYFKGNESLLVCEYCDERRLV